MGSASTNDGMNRAAVPPGDGDLPERARRPKIWEASVSRVLVFVAMIFGLGVAMLLGLPTLWLKIPLVGIAVLLLFIPELGLYLMITAFMGLARWVFGMFFYDEAE
jgi:hypothetical protein